uniref:Uncharacterized protein n=1 Tax=Toxoplasma gondii COUG TaxID=1074873 RepID=A0A2G8XZN5_TOXGO|nr:hypothetical protein TGCOUG_291690 [Toxoplasma gondii COUG]
MPLPWSLPTMSDCRQVRWICAHVFFCLAFLLALACSTQSVCSLALTRTDRLPRFRVGTDILCGQQPWVFRRLAYSAQTRRATPHSACSSTLLSPHILRFLAFQLFPFSPGVPATGGSVNPLRNPGSAVRFRSQSWRTVDRSRAFPVLAPEQLTFPVLSAHGRMQFGFSAVASLGEFGNRWRGCGGRAPQWSVCSSANTCSPPAASDCFLTPHETTWLSSWSSILSRVSLAGAASALFAKRRPTAGISAGDAEDEESEEQQEEEQFVLDPSKVRSRFGSLTEPGPSPEIPPESPYWPSFPAKRVTPVPAKLPRWHPRSPFPTLQPRGPFYPANPRKTKPPKCRRFKGEAPPPVELPRPPAKLRRDFRTWVRDAHYEYPQFTTIQASLRYRRRLKRSSRKLDWRLKSLQNRRMYFAWRRNMRDQETHRWIREMERWSLLAARYWKNQYALQAQRWIAGDQEPDSSAVSEDSDVGGRQNEGQQDGNLAFEEAASPDVGQDAEEMKPAESCAEQHGEQQEERVRRLSKRREASLRDTRGLCRGEDKAEDILRSADVEALDDVLRRGYRLPPMTASVAASPIPWWSSAKGLHKWRGRKTATNVQSRWVNWANPTREVEAVVAGQLLRRQGRVLQHLRDKGVVLRETLQRVATQGNVMADAEKPELRGDVESVESPPGVSLESAGETHADPSRDLSVETRRLKAIEAAMDVAMMLGQSVVTKTSGASTPYDVHSPFMRSHTSSRRRRNRMRGRMKDPDQRNMTRQERRLANFARRQKAAAEDRAALKEARRKAWEARAGAGGS